MKSCIILCGGQSRRMGQDKGLLKLNGTPMIIHTLKIVEDIVDEIILVLRDQTQLDLYKKCVNNFENENPEHNTRIKIVTDIEMDEGPLFGLYTGLSYIKSEGSLILPCDSPFISPYFVNKMFELTGERKCQAMVPVWPDGSTEPLHSYYRKECIPVIQDRLKNGFRNVKSLLDKIDVGYIDVNTLDPDKRSFINLNRPEDVDTSFEKIRKL